MVSGVNVNNFEFFFILFQIDAEVREGKIKFKKEHGKKKSKSAILERPI